MKLRAADTNAIPRRSQQSVLSMGRPRRGPVVSRRRASATAPGGWERVTIHSLVFYGRSLELRRKKIVLHLRKALCHNGQMHDAA